MPKRPRQHITGDKASLTVQSVIAQAGCAVEAIRNDYGEDLLVQTSHAGEIDPSRLWIQVKGTHSINNYSRQSGGFAYRFPFKHAIKWVRSSDPVVVVLWDLDNDIGYFAKPAELIDESAHHESGRKTTTLLFSSADTFDAQSVTRLAWESRFERYRQLILTARDAMEDNEHDTAAYEKSQLLMTGYVIDLLRLIGIVEQNKNQVTEAARDNFLKHYEELHGDDDPQDPFYGSAMVTILQHATEIAGTGLTLAVIAPCTSIFIAALGLHKLRVPEPT
jgi:hypothetical protein